MKKIFHHVDALPAALRARFEEVGSQDTFNPILLAKYFKPSGSIWYATDLRTNDVCLGYKMGKGREEWVFFNPHRLPMERDVHFKEMRFGDLLELPENAHYNRKSKQVKTV